MFDLEREIESWRRDLLAAGLQAPEVIRELEEHLRDDIEAQVRAGAGLSEAFRAAVRKIGPPTVLREEFDLVGPAGFRRTLRRHKWKILVCAGVTSLAAIMLHVLRPTPYQSEAKLLFRYAVIDEQSLANSSARPNATSFAEPGKTTLMAQVEILTSMDLAQRVAEAIGPERLLAKAGGGRDLVEATALIRSGLSVELLPGSSLVRIAFRHPDSRILQPVLREVLDRFLKMHVEVFRHQITVSRVSNISLVQAPSAPVFDFGAAVRPLAIVVVAGILSGFVWVLADTLCRHHARRDLRGTS